MLKEFLSKRVSLPHVSNRLVRAGARLSAALASCFVLILCDSAALADNAISTNWRDYAIVGQNTISLNSYSTVLGDIYSAGDMTLQFGYGIQRPSENAGNMYTQGNFAENSLSQVTGNVAANGNVTILGSANLTGNVAYGGTLSYPYQSSINGTVTQKANSVPSVALPAPKVFTPGTQNINATNDLTLPPGSYGDVKFSGLYDNLALSSGDYFLKSLNVPNSNNLYLNLTNGPIRVFVQGDITTSGYLRTYVNGTEATDGAVPRSLAANVLFETHGNLTIGYHAFDFFGTMYAPYGAVNADVRDMCGSILAGGPISANVYLVGQTCTAIPEPSSGVLAGFAVLALTAWIWRRRK